MSDQQIQVKTNSANTPKLDMPQHSENKFDANIDKFNKSEQTQSIPESENNLNKSDKSSKANESNKITELNKVSELNKVRESNKISESNQANGQEQIIQKLDEILHQLKQINRVNIQRDFSFARLIGAIAQILVIGMLFWIIVGIIDLGEISIQAATTFKILGATLLQMIALTFFILDQQDK